MKQNGDGVIIRKLSTGVPGLDEVLGGGIPELSFNLIVGGPGSGKTTLAHQILFTNASAELPALYFTILGEPPLKMLRYQQQMSYFDAAKVGGVIRFVSLSDQVLRGGLSSVLDTIVREVDAASPSFVAVDSFRSVIRATTGMQKSELELQDFSERLALHLTAWQATTFLVGEFADPENHDHPVYTVADGLVVLGQQVERSSVVRRIRVVKMRGQSEMAGVHSFRITDNGIRVFPRPVKASDDPGDTKSGKKDKPVVAAAPRRLSTGVSGLDTMLHGGIPFGYSALVAGPSGSGKTMLAAQFIVAGVKSGEPGVMALFEKRPVGYLKSTAVGQELSHMIGENKVGIVELRPLDLSVDETLHELREEITRIGAKRVVLDSLGAFEMALAPGFREDFREAVYRVVSVLTGLGVTVMMTLEIEDAYNELRLGPREAAFLTDVIVLQRYAETTGKLQKLITVVKVRASDHSKDIRLYEINSTGLVVTTTTSLRHGMLSGQMSSVPPEKSAKSKKQAR